MQHLFINVKLPFPFLGEIQTGLSLFKLIGVPETDPKLISNRVRFKLN